MIRARLSLLLRDELWYDVRAQFRSGGRDAFGGFRVPLLDRTELGARDCACDCAALCARACDCARDCAAALCARDCARDCAGVAMLKC